MADWLRLDNAALIFPAIRRRDWTNAFRVSATLNEPVNPEILQRAVDALAPRFPSMYVSLHRGAFWYYLQKLPQGPRVGQDGACPLIHMTGRELRRCCLRVLYYENRIAVEIFHALTDGSGGMVYLKTVTAAYLSLAHGIPIPAQEGVLDRNEAPRPEELEDSFTRAAGHIPLSRREASSLRLRGQREEDGFLHLTIATVREEALLNLAHEYHGTVTALLCAVMLQSILALAKRPQGNRWAKVTVAVNLRRIFGSQTLRNFALYVTPEIDPQLGDYSFKEICSVVHHRMGLDCTAKLMGTRIAANVSSEKAFILKVMPLFIKNAAMKAVFDAVGERKSCLCLSNLGNVTVPEAMRPYISRMDFIIGVQARAPHNCGVLSYNGTMYINMIRNITEPELELHFFRVLQDQGLHVKAESNQP